MISNDELQQLEFLKHNYLVLLDILKKNDNNKAVEFAKSVMQEMRSKVLELEKKKNAPQLW